MKITTAEQMRNLDAVAINEFRVPSLELMENAGRGSVDVMVRRFGSPKGKTIVIFAGPGNNGGDGLVIARHLFQLGADPVVFLLVPQEKLKGDAAVNLEFAKKLEIPLHPLQEQADLEQAEKILAKSWLAVDAVFGTGLTREIAGHFAAALRLLNDCDCPVVAVDIPSGLNTDSGRPLGAAVRAELTVTFGLAKLGQVIYPGREYTGSLEIVDIGIPEAAVAEVGISIELLDSELAKKLPERPPTAHKGSFGHLLIAAGSTGKTGAAMLCGLGALRIGTGLVTLCVPADLNFVFETALWEAMTVPLQSPARGMLTMADLPVILEAAAGKQAMVIGPGLGTSPETAELVAALYRDFPRPLLVDADGLNILSQMPGSLTAASGPRILTPHPGEMSRLTGHDTGAIQSDRPGTALDFAGRHEVVLVLKGADTVVASPDGRLAINSTGNPGMAAGGMGDVLSGLIGGLLAQGMEPWDAACLGVYLQGLAGDLLALETPAGYLASEVADTVPEAVRVLQDEDGI